MNTLKVKVENGRNFYKGVKYAKKFGGKFNPSDKTWSIPEDRPEIGNIRAYYLTPVDTGASGPEATTKWHFAKASSCDCTSGKYGGACTCC